MKIWASEITKQVQARLMGPDRYCERVENLRYAGEHDLSFVLWPKDIVRAKKSQVGILVCSSQVAADFASDFNKTLIISDDFKSVFELLYKYKNSFNFSGQKISGEKISSKSYIHETCVVKNSRVGSGCIINANCFIDDDVDIGADCEIGPGVIILSGTKVGNGVKIGPRCVLASGAFAPYGQRESINLKSLGWVFVGDHAEIGAGSIIDRGLLGVTQIGEFAQIDNLVHVGHDCRIGKYVIIAAQSGLAGLVELGDYATLGGQCGVAPLVLVGQGARISGKSFVHGNIMPKSVWSGNPAVPHELYLRAYKKMLKSG